MSIMCRECFLFLGDGYWYLAQNCSLPNLSLDSYKLPQIISLVLLQLLSIVEWCAFQVGVLLWNLQGKNLTKIPHGHLCGLEIDRYGFFGVDTDISVIHEPIPINGISKIIKSCFLLHYQKYNVFYALPFFKIFRNQDLWVKNFQIVAISIFCYEFLINLSNDDAFVSAATADACFMVHPVSLFMKTHLLVLLQDNLSWLRSLYFLAQVIWMCEEYNSVLSTSF